MKIGRLIERNVFTSIWLFFFTSILLIYLIFGESHNEDVKFIYCWFAGKYISWPLVLFEDQIRGSLLDQISGLIVTYSISLVSCMAGDFLLRRIFWDKKKNIDAISRENINKTSIAKIVQVVTGIVKWTGRLLACSLIPFLMFGIETCKYHHDEIAVMRIYIAIIGCIAGWRFPLMGAILLSIWILPFHIRSWAFVFDKHCILSDSTAILFFAMWVLNKFYEKALKKNGVKQL